jgi:hypothetical protein
VAEIEFNQIIQSISENLFSSAIVRQSDIFQSFKGSQKYAQNKRKTKDIRILITKKNQSSPYIKSKKDTYDTLIKKKSDIFIKEKSNLVKQESDIK